MIQFAVCDDEPFLLDEIAARLLEYAQEQKLVCKVNRFTNGNKLLESNERIDILFLDIQMDDPDGIKTAKLLRERGFQGVLIFVTILKENVFDAFEVQAFDYLVKPLDDGRFRRTIERAIKTVEQSAGKSLLLQKSGSCQLILFSQIVYFEVIGRKIYLHRQSGEVIDYYHRLDDLEKCLDQRFFRCHRSYLVNLDYVSGYHAGLVSLAEGGKIPFSRLREQDFAQALLSHMKERRR